MGTESASLFLLDVSRELLARAKDAKSNAISSDSEYDRGRQFAFYEVISLLAQQADSFGIDRACIGLDSVDAEVDLLG